MEFLGKIVTPEGISVAPDKIEVVQSWPVPNNTTHLLSFLGFLNYHRDHIQQYAEITACLYELAQKKGSFDWGPQHEKACQAGRNALTSAPCLSFPTADGHFILDTDASDTFIGASLCQM